MKRKLEEMESENHENFPAVMKIVKEYCEKKKEVEDKNKKRMMRVYSGTNGAVAMQVVGRDSNGKLILIPKSYAKASQERKLREEEERKKKESDGEPLPPRQPRWSDEILANHMWRTFCRSKGMKPQKYVLRTDPYRNMTREEVKLDMLFRKVYKKKEQEEAAAAASTS